MKIKLVRLFVSTAVAFLLLSWGQNLCAQTTTPPPAKANKPVNSPAAAGLLSQAYSALAAADHDYQGNRVRAMKQIEIAAKILGVTLSGDGKVKELQTTSDQQLRTAQALLQQAVVAGLKPKPQTHVEKALAFLTTALAIK
jgi:hypothetical protein